MFDNNVFIPGTFTNYSDGAKVKGYEMKTNITYYRGIPLSMVNDIRVESDGQPVPREDIRCSVDEGENWFTLDEMQTVVEHKWEYGEPMTVRVLQEDGLPKGEHDVKLTVIVRTAYIPVPLEGSQTRRVTVA